jgi:hypothetical protein
MHSQISNIYILSDMLLIIISFSLIFGPSASHADSAQNTQCDTSGVSFSIECCFFDSWTQVNLLISQRNKSASVGNLYLKTKRPIVLTSEFSIENLISVDKSETKSKEIVLNMYGLEGINVTPWPQNQSALFNQRISNITLNVDHSLAEFYMKGNAMNELECTTSATHKNETTLFNYFRKVMFNPRIQYSNKPICPYIFKNSHLKSFSLYGLENSLVLMNLWRFENTASNVSTINSNISELNLAGYKYSFNENILDRLVFEQLTSLRIISSVGSIQSDLFKSF